MLENAKAFATFSVKDLQEAKEFYGQKLGLKVVERAEGLELQFAGDARKCGADLLLRTFSNDFR